MKRYRDHFFLKAKREQYPARSIYKLKELDDKFRLFRRGMKVLDLGAAPGSWSLGAAEKVGAGGVVVACDLTPTDTAFPPCVRFFVEDACARSPEFEAVLAQAAPFDVVLSDMAPRTTGAKGTDQARSLELCLEALAVAERYLAQGGGFVVKLFMGPDARDLLRAMHERFATVKSFKPRSSRPESKEIFCVGLGFKG
jgi:23S rRNA (uridine2552-2'-O)-methyltransferase